MGGDTGILVGRPKFQIDYEQVEKLAKIHCTQEEIASILGCSVDTLQRDDKFCGVYKNGISNGKMSLRRKQWAAVEEGNTTMLIWLGKQYLGQREPPKAEEVDATDDLAKAIATLADKLPS